MAELHKVTVNFIEPAYAAVLHAAEITGLNKTDTINRAAQFYDWAMIKRSEGYRICIERNGDVEAIEFL